jgi:hypothetical protein
MKLSELTAQYITHKQSMGMRFCTEERALKSFCLFLSRERQSQTFHPRPHHRPDFRATQIVASCLPRRCRP